MSNDSFVERCEYLATELERDGSSAEAEAIRELIEENRALKAQLDIAPFPVDADLKTNCHTATVDLPGGGKLAVVGGTRGVGRTAALIDAGIRQATDKLQKEVANLEAIVAGLVRNWPGVNGDSGPVLYRHSNGTWFLETCSGDTWYQEDVIPGPYATRDEAVMAAAEAEIEKVRKDRKENG